MAERVMGAADLAVLEQALPPGMTADMRELAGCLFKGLLHDNEAPLSFEGERAPLLRWAATVVCRQMQMLADEIGGSMVYLPKGMQVFLTARDAEICSKFRGDYTVLAREYHLSEMRVRQIVDGARRARFLERQGNLPGVET